MNSVCEDDEINWNLNQQKSASHRVAHRNEYLQGFLPNLLPASSDLGRLRMVDETTVRFKARRPDSGVIPSIFSKYKQFLAYSRKYAIQLPLGHYVLRHIVIGWFTSSERSASIYANVLPFVSSHSEKQQTA